MAKSVPVTVNLDSRLWWKLSLVAEKHNMTIAVLLSELAQKLVEKPQPVVSARGASTKGTVRPTYLHSELDANVALMYGQSMSDAGIARAIGCSAETVRQARIRLRLPARGEYGKGKSSSAA